MAIKHIIVLFVETPHKFITAKLSIRTPGSSSVLIIIIIISTDEDPGLRIESFAVINLRGVSTNKTIIIIMLFYANFWHFVTYVTYFDIVAYFEDFRLSYFSFLICKCPEFTSHMNND